MKICFQNILLYIRSEFPDNDKMSADQQSGLLHSILINPKYSNSLKWVINKEFIK
jgi:hypothetical protein